MRLDLPPTGSEQSPPSDSPPTLVSHLRQKAWECRSVWITAPIVAGLVIALRLTGALQWLELLAMDQYVRLRPPEPRDDRILIVGVTEKDINAYYYPVPDRELARLLNQIKRHQPRAIGLDIYRDLPVPKNDPQGHAALVNVFETTPNLIGIHKKAVDQGEQPIYPSSVLEKRGQIGINNAVQDPDGKIRRSFLYWSKKNRTGNESIDLKLAQIYLKAEGIQPKTTAYPPYYLQLNQAIFPYLRKNDGGYVGIDSGGYQIFLNYRGRTGHFDTVSMADVIENRVSTTRIKDKIVLIGMVSDSTNDYVYTPYSSGGLSAERMPGVENIANVTSQLISAALNDRPLIRVWGEAQELWWIVLWALCGAIFSAGLRPSVPNASVSLVIAVAVLGGGTFWAFLAGWWLPIVPPLFALVGTAIVNISYIATQEYRDRQIVMQIFERKVSRDVAEIIWRDRQHFLDSGRLPARKMIATVLFTDLRNFTQIAQHTTPEVLLFWLDTYLETMSQIVLANGGIVDKFIGDSIMALYGVPIPRTTPEAIALDAQNAVQSALEMAAKLDALNQHWQAQGLPTVSMRIGIATGAVITGSLGGCQKLEYTALGDCVNVASRLEGFDKQFESGTTRILISQTTYQHLNDRFPTRFVDRVHLKGRDEITDVYQVWVK